MIFIVVLSILLQLFKSFAISECNFKSDLIQKENLTKLNALLTTVSDMVSRTLKKDLTPSSKFLDWPP